MKQYQAKLGTPLYVDKECSISPDLLVEIIEEIVEQFNSKEITAYVFKTVITDLCHLYGGVMFYDVRKKQYSKEIVDNFCTETICLLNLCFTNCDIRYATDREYPSRTIYVENMEIVNCQLIAKIIEVIIDRLYFDSITVEEFKEVMIDFCSLYGNLIFDDLKILEYSIDMEEYLNDDAKRLIELCLLGIELKLISEYEEDEFYEVKF